MSKIKVAIAGCGSRGFHAYGKELLTLKDAVEIVAIADIVEEKRKLAKETFGLSEEQVFDSAEEMIAAGKLGDAMVIATPDRQHVKQAIPALRAGYHLLLEKPISPVLAELQELVEVVEETGKHVVVCHVLRYTPFYRKLKEVLDSGVIGEVGSTLAYEDVGYWHQAHSFVRGNWRNTAESSPMILQKCCHDMDIYTWLLGRTASRVSSFGNTFLFHSGRAPEGATKYCMGGCQVKTDCPFDAEELYINSEVTGVAHGKTGWPVNTVVVSPTVEDVSKALKDGPYGRCVYYCDNDVVDHQVLISELDNGSSFSFTMSGLTAHGGRWAKFMGTKGEIVADMSKNTITIMRFGEEDEIVNLNLLVNDLQGHGGGDAGIVDDFIKLLQGNEDLDMSRLTTASASTESHYIALAAEKSRLQGGNVIAMEDMR